MISQELGIRLGNVLVFKLKILPSADISRAFLTSLGLKWLVLSVLIRVPSKTFFSKIANLFSDNSSLVLS